MAKILSQNFRGVTRTKRNAFSIIVLFSGIFQIALQREEETSIRLSTLKPMLGNTCSCRRGSETSLCFEFVGIMERHLIMSRVKRVSLRLFPALQL